MELSQDRQTKELSASDSPTGTQGGIINSLGVRQLSIANLTANKKWTVAFVKELLPEVTIRFDKGGSPASKPFITTGNITGRKNDFADVWCYLPHYNCRWHCDFSWVTISRCLNEGKPLLVN